MVQSFTRYIAIMNVFGTLMIFFSSIMTRKFIVNFMES